MIKSLFLIPLVLATIHLKSPNVSDILKSALTADPALVGSKHFYGTTLAYVTPWNTLGQAMAVQHAHKFNLYLSQCL
jgi:hypothetical protein